MILGVLGGIGAGKSTVTRMLVDLGADSVDADALAHAALGLSDVREEIRRAFGDSVFRQETVFRQEGQAQGGEVDRGALADRVFSDGNALERLERIIHPRVEAEVIERVRTFQSRSSRTAGSGDDGPDATGAQPGARVLVLDVPLLASSPLKRLCDAFVFIEARAESRRERTALRGWTAAELEKREVAQVAIDDKLRLADYVIENSSDLESLARQVRKLYEEIKGPPSR
jgi:dephospho-CoA kinase